MYHAAFTTARRKPAPGWLRVAQPVMANKVALPPEALVSIESVRSVAKLK